MKTTLTSQPEQDGLFFLKINNVSRFFRPISGFFRLISAFFARGVHNKKCVSGNFGLSL
jgi:hypothetical protein